jgi:sulfide dehydrogenase cytochrome subunit
MIAPRIATLFLLAILAGPSSGIAQVVDPNQGRNLAANCFNCHGTNGSAVGAMPPLAGQTKDALVKSLQEFREGKRPATIMHQIAKGYSEAQITAIASYLSQQKPR